jgi:hypothetical protein
MKLLVYKDEEGTMRPNAFVTKSDEYGKIRADEFLKKEKVGSIVEAELTETNE